MRQKRTSGSFHEVKGKIRLHEKMIRHGGTAYMGKSSVGKRARGWMPWRLTPPPLPGLVDV